MYRRQPVFQAADRAVVGSGLLPDVHSLQVPLWTVGANARFLLGRVERLVPPSLIVAAGGAGRGLHQQQVLAGTRYIWFANDLGQIKQWFGPAPTLIDTIAVQQHQSAAKNASMVDFTTYGDWTIINGGEAQAKIYKPGTGLAAYGPAASPNVLQYMKMLAFVLAIGHDNGKRYSWSRSTNIEDWVATTENDAGSAPIEDLNTRIRAASRLGQYISVYAEDQMALISFIGAPAYFTHRVVLDGIGAVGKAAVATDGRANYGVSRNGVWRTDGQSFDYIDKGSLQKYLQNNVNWDQASKIVASRNDVTGNIDFYFPIDAAMENTEGWSFDPSGSGWSKLPAIGAQMERALFRRPIAIDGANNLVLLDDNPALAGALDLQTKPFPVAGPHGDVLLDEADFLLKTATNVEFRLGCAEKTDDASFVDWSSWQALQTDLRTYRLDLRVSAAFHKLQIRNTADNWALDFQGFLLYGVPIGSRRDNA